MKPRAWSSVEIFKAMRERLDYLEEELLAAKKERDMMYDLLTGDNQKIAAQLKDCIEALEFYGDKRSWKTVTISNHNQRFCIMQGSDLEYFQEPNQDSYCGKRAREVLRKIKGEK